MECHSTTLKVIRKFTNETTKVDAEKRELVYSVPVEYLEGN